MSALRIAVAAAARYHGAPRSPVARAHGDRRGLRVHARHGVLARLRQLRAESGDPRRKDAAAPGARHDPARLPAAALRRDARRTPSGPAASSPIRCRARTRSARRRPDAVRDLLRRLSRTRRDKATVRSPQDSELRPPTRRRACAPCPTGRIFHVDHLRVGHRCRPTRRSSRRATAGWSSPTCRRCSARESSHDPPRFVARDRRSRRVACRAGRRRRRPRPCAGAGAGDPRRTWPNLLINGFYMLVVALVGIVFIALQYLCPAPGGAAASAGSPRR